MPIEKSPDSKLIVTILANSFAAMKSLGKSLQVYSYNKTRKYFCPLDLHAV